MLFKNIVLIFLVFVFLSKSIPVIAVENNFINKTLTKITNYKKMLSEKFRTEIREPKKHFRLAVLFFILPICNLVLSIILTKKLYNLQTLDKFIVNRVYRALIPYLIVNLPSSIAIYYIFYNHFHPQISSDITFTRKIVLFLVMSCFNFLNICGLQSVSLISAEKKYIAAIEANDIEKIKFYREIFGISQYLYFEIYKNNFKSLKALLADSGLDHIKESEWEAAIRTDNIGILNLLSNYSRSFDPDIKIYHHERNQHQIHHISPAIIYALLNCKPSIFKFLLKHDAYTLVTDENGKTINDYLDENPERKYASHVRAILKKYKLKIFKEVDEHLIPDLANMVVDYVV